MLPRSRRTHLSVTEVGEELVLFDHSLQKAHRLNPTAARIWRWADGTTSLQDLAARLEDALGTQGGPELVSLTLDRLGEAGLLERAGEYPRVTRRHAMKMAAGIAVALLPAVTSILAPTPAMAQSGGGSTGADSCPDGFLRNPYTGQCEPEPEPAEEEEPTPEDEPEPEPEPEEER